MAAALLTVLFGPAATSGRAAVTCTPSAPIASPATGDIKVTIHHPPAGAPEADARQCTPGEHAVLRGIWTIMVSAKSDLSYLKAFTVSIVPSDPSIKMAPDATVAGGPYRDPNPLVPPPSDPNTPILNQDTITFPWDTANLTNHNGVYQIKISAQSGVDSVEAFVLDLKVDNPPSRPTEVQVVPDGSVAVVSWKRNPEPDVIGYRVLRSADGGSPVRLDTVSGLQSRDDTAPQGSQLRYQVAAVRKSVISKTIMSASSDPSPALTIGSAIGVPGRSVARPPRAFRSTRGPAFEPELPYDADPPPQQAPPAQAPSGASEAVAEDATPQVLEGPQSAEDTRSTSTFDKMRYFGTSLFLLVVGLLVARFARRILSAV